MRKCISIHAPHEGERREGVGWYEVIDIDFNPRSPRGGATADGRHGERDAKFQSTLPTRGSDCLFLVQIARQCYFNPRSPRGGATSAILRYLRSKDISIHAPHEGERRKGQKPQRELKNISIHAPHEGERLVLADACSNLGNISIHAPHEGERPAPNGLTLKGI